MCNVARRLVVAFAQCYLSSGYGRVLLFVTMVTRGRPFILFLPDRRSVGYGRYEWSVENVVHYEAVSAFDIVVCETGTE